jgi:hypothetical protein
MTKAQSNLIECYNKGYRVIDSKVYYKGKLVKGSITNGYHFIGIRINKKIYNIRTHRLVGYQKYKNLLFESNLVLRHIDNNSLNNSEDNIVLGTPSENMMDKPETLRYSVAKHAASFLIKYNHIAIKDYYYTNKSYKKVMEKFNISSKGTLHHILNSK